MLSHLFVFVCFLGSLGIFAPWTLLSQDLTQSQNSGLSSGVGHNTPFYRVTHCQSEPQWAQSLPEHQEKVSELQGVFREQFPSISLSDHEIEQLVVWVHACAQSFAQNLSLGYSRYVHRGGELGFDLQFYPSGRIYIHLGLKDPQHKRGGYKFFSRSIEFGSGTLVANLQVSLQKETQTDSVLRELYLLEKLSGCEACLSLLDYGAYARQKGSLGFDLSMQTELFEADLKARYQRVGSVRHFLRIAQASVKALQHLHEQGVVHRDVKPANFLVRGVGKDIRLAISDYGLSESEEQEPFGEKLVGTRGYIDPTLCLNRMTRGRAYETLAEGASGDLFSLGVMFYRLWFSSKDRMRQALRKVNLLALPRGGQGVIRNFAFQHALKEYRRLYAEKIRQTQRKITGPKRIIRIRGRIAMLILKMIHPDPKKRIKVENVLSILKHLTEDYEKHRNSA